jgi:hypothetical protein
MWTRHAVTSYHVIHAAQVDDATILRVTAFLRHRLKILKPERRRPYNISCCNVLSSRLETMEARSADSFALFPKLVPIIYLHNINGIFSTDTVCFQWGTDWFLFCDLDVMLQFVPNYVHVVGEKFVPGSLYATKNNTETLHRPQIFLKASIHLC